MLALFADDAEVTMAPGTFRGKAAIRKFFEWEVRMVPVATSTDAGLGMAVVGPVGRVGVPDFGDGAGRAIYGRRGKDSGV